MEKMYYDFTTMTNQEVQDELIRIIDDEEKLKSDSLCRVLFKESTDPEDFRRMDESREAYERLFQLKKEHKIRKEQTILQ